MKKWTPKVEFTQVEGKVICSDDRKKKKKLSHDGVVCSLNSQWNLL